MGSILARKRKDGSMSFTARVRIHEKRIVIHEEIDTFDTRGAAKEWAKNREVELKKPGALAAAKQGPTSLASLIKWYRTTFGPISKWQRSKECQLEFLEGHSIGEVDALQLSTQILIDHIRDRRKTVQGPTAANDLIWIGCVLEAAKAGLSLPINLEVVAEARLLCSKLRLISKSKRRERRPTSDELQRLDDYFCARDRDPRTVVPMRTIMWFAIYSTRRESEICRLEWDDNDSLARTGLVRDAKHPRSKDGNHQRFKYTPEGWDIVQQQPRVSQYVFPYDPKSVSAAFADACGILGIKDLRFHDLRHEATSRLFEHGYEIHEVAQFSLHKDWKELKRYTNLRPENLREIVTLPNGEKVLQAANNPIRTLPCPPATELRPQTTRRSRSPVVNAPF